LDEKTSVGFSDKSSGRKKTRIYDLGVILAVDYRVNSKQGIEFGGWSCDIYFLLFNNINKFTYEVWF